MRFTTYCAVAALALGGCNMMNKDKKEESGDHAKKMASSDLPPKIQSAVNSKFPGAQIRSAEKETEDGKVIYDVELTHSGKHYEMDINEDGTIAETESAIAASALPAPVSQAVQAKYPGGTMKEVMEKRKGSEQAVSEYEIVVQPTSGKSKELTVAPDGRVTEEAAGEEK